jgi:tetratricopeptide (TPR) repeat protein
LTVRRKPRTTAEVQNISIGGSGGVVRVRIAVLVILLGFAVSSFAMTMEEFDARAEQELASLAPDAVPAWRQANAARAAERFEEAAALYASVTRLAPGFDHAWRRQSSAELASGNRTAALEHARHALSLRDSAENMAAVAHALIFTEGRIGAGSAAGSEEARGARRRARAG